MNEKEIDKSFITNASNILADTNDGLTGTIIDKLLNPYAVKYNVLIPYATIGKASNKRTGLAENLHIFNAPAQFEIISNLCDNKYISEHCEVKKLRQNLWQRYGELASSKISEEKIVIETKSFLKNYPNVLEVYNSGLEKFEQKRDMRNALDDMRLALELLLKSVCKKNTSLENQISNIGNLMKSKMVSSEISNMWKPLVDCYSKYQNNNVKHNDLTKINEVEFIIELTTLMMKFIIKTYENNN